MICNMENHSASGGNQSPSSDVNEDLEKAIAISLGNLPLHEDESLPSYQSDVRKSPTRYKSNLYNGIEDISEEEQIKRLLELSKEESERVQTLADQISEEEQMKKILELSRRESEVVPINDVNSIIDEFKVYSEKQHQYSETCKYLEQRRSSAFRDDPAIVDLKKSPKSDNLKFSDNSEVNQVKTSDDNFIYFSDDEGDDDQTNTKSSSLGATSNPSLEASSSSPRAPDKSEYMDDASFSLWMSLSADQRRETLVANNDTTPQARPSTPTGPSPPSPLCPLESTAAHNRLATLTELRGDGSIVPQGMSEEDALQQAIEESKKLMEQGRGRDMKGVPEDELVRLAMEESKQEALSNQNWPGLSQMGARPKKRVATPFVPPQQANQRSTPFVPPQQANQRSSTPPSRPSWEEVGTRRKPRNGMSRSPEHLGRRSNSNPASGSGYSVRGMSEEEQMALAMSQSRLEASSPPVVAFRGELREVVVDGSNVGMAHGGHQQFSVRGISICVEHMTKLGHKTLVMMPRHRWNRASPEEKEVLDALERSKLLFYTPGRKTTTSSWTCYDDRFIVEYAARHGGVVLTNDNYRDLADEQKFSDTIENRLLPYMWAEDTLMIPDDPMGRDGPKLEEFLRK